MYGARFFPFGKKYDFASGAGVFLGKCAIQKITTFDRATSGFGPELIEDVEIARVLGDEFRIRVPVPRINVNMNMKHVMTVEEYNGKVSDGLFHYKFKNKDRGWDASELRKFHCADYRAAMCVRNKGRL
jgi:hypothetical protein